MFLRAHRRSKDGKEHRYWSLVETVRTPEGPRQRRLCYLGELNDSAQARWLKTIEVFNGQGESTQLKLFPSDVELPAEETNVAQVLLQKVRLERTRQLGPCYLGWELWRRLKLDEFFQSTLDTDGADVPWSQVAAILAINRLCAPGSELALEQRWYPATALGDILHIEEGKINDTRLYRCLDHTLPQKTKLEQHLKQRYGELFAAEFDVMLYDLTSTYVEGDAGANPMMRRGYSRDHRPDCLQLVLALIVNAEGFPCSYEVFNGNRADVTTMEVMLRIVERKYGKARRIWVMDRGIVSEANLAAIRKREGQYLVGTPRSKMKEFESHLAEKANWEQVRDEVQVKLIPTPEGQETFILCKTEGRQKKEQAIRNRFATRLEAALDNLKKQVKAGRLKNRDKIHIRIGRLLASHPHVADLYTVEVKQESGQLRVEWVRKSGQQQWREAREGAYLLRTNLSAATASELWEKYMQLTEVEASFRALKSELSIRPLYHQREPRVKAHVMVAFLGYALWVTLKHLLRRSSSEWSAQRALGELSTLQSADIILPTTDGREIHLRRITEPTTAQQKLLSQLGIELPTQFQINQQCSADFAVA
ncbi:MAG TPA: IS1634 family transposase [Candidatus Angelobacter sp.]